MTAYLLDTNIVSDLIRNPDGRAQARLEDLDTAVFTSAIVAGEVRFGLLNNPDMRGAARVEGTLAQIEARPFDGPCAPAYASIRLALRGQEFGGNDMLIAAQAITYDATLVSADRGFERVDGLKLENWLRPDAPTEN